MSRDWAVRLSVLSVTVAVALAFSAASCAKKVPPVARPMPPPAASPGSPTTPAPSTPSREPVTVPPEPLREETMAARSLDDLNREPPLKPIDFYYDSAELSAEAQAVLDANVALLKKIEAWVITVEGHCDERGTAEYNLALGERRAVAAKTYLVSLGIAADRIRTVSYGKEMPFEKGHDEAAWAANRRAHFVITAK